MPAYPQNNFLTTGTHMIANKSKSPSLERLGKIKLPPPDTSIYHNENKILH